VSKYPYFTPGLCPQKKTGKNFKNIQGGRKRFFLVAIIYTPDTSFKDFSDEF